MPVTKNSADTYAGYLPFALALLTFAVFSPVLWHGFINYDDPAFVVQNPAIQSGVTLEGIRWAFTTAYEVNWIPLTWISHMLDMQLFGMSPVGHHFVNLLFHIANTLLLFTFFKRTTNEPWRSAAVALLFAVHPLHVESVAWVAERKDVLSAFFWMLTLYAYVRYTEKPYVVRYLSVLGIFIMGLLAKPMIVTLPFILLLLDWWPLDRLHRHSAGGTVQTGNRVLKLILEKVPLVFLAVCVSIITYLVQQSDISQQYAFLERAARALIAYTAYLAKMAWPSDLAVIYPFSSIPPSAGLVALSAIILTAMTGMAIMLRHRYPYLITGWLWFLITLLPVIGLVQIGHHFVADRYTYLSSIGIFIMIVWGISEVLNGWRFRGAILGILSSVTLTSLIILTLLQLQHWKNSAALFRHAIEVTENNWIAHNNLGQALLEEGKTEEAIYQFTEALKANPASALAYLNLGFAYRSKNDLEKASDAFEHALQYDATCHPAHFGLGLVNLGMGHRELAQKEYEYLLASGSMHAPELLSEMISYDVARTSAN